MDRRPAAILHIGALPISIEIKHAQADSPNGNVVMFVRTARPKRRTKVKTPKRR